MWWLIIDSPLIWGGDINLSIKSQSQQLASTKHTVFNTILRRITITCPYPINLARKLPNLLHLPKGNTHYYRTFGLDVYQTRPHCSCTSCGKPGSSPTKRNRSTTWRCLCDGHSFESTTIFPSRNRLFSDMGNSSGRRTENPHYWEYSVGHRSSSTCISYFKHCQAHNNTSTSTPKSAPKSTSKSISISNTGTDRA